VLVTHDRAVAECGDRILVLEVDCRRPSVARPSTVPKV
jgi:hypothetical protein